MSTSYKPSKPAASDGLNISQGDIQGNFADLATELAKEHDFVAPNYLGSLKAGASRAYYEDYQSSPTTPAAGYRSGRLNLSSNTNYKGQLRYHDGTNWLPLVGRSGGASSDTATAVNPNGSWTDWDNAGLSITPYLEDSWVYKFEYHGVFQLTSTSNDALEVRIYDTTSSAVIAYGYHFTMGATVSPQIVNISLIGLYTPAATAQKTIKVQVKAAVNASEALAKAPIFGTGTTAAHTIAFQELPA